MLLAVDFETGLIAPGNPHPKPVCMSVATSGGVGLVTGAEGVRLIEQALAAGWSLATAYGRFDLWVATKHSTRSRELARLWVEAAEQGRIHDVLIRQKLLDMSVGAERPKYNLSAVSEACGLGPLDKGEDTYRLRYAELDGVPIEDYPADAYRYATLDAQRTLDVFHVQERMREHGSPFFPGMDPLRDEAAQVRASLAIEFIASNGLRTNPATVARFRAQLERRYVTLRDLLLSYGLLRQEKGKFVRCVANAQALAESVLTNPKRTPKGKIKLDNDACSTKLADGNPHPALAAYGEFASIQKTLGTDFRILEAAALQPFHAYYDSLRSTGRTSTGGGDTVGNVQNMPRRPGVRECYVPSSPDYVFAESDWSAVELSTFAQVCYWVLGYSETGRMINEGIDLHLVIAAALLGLTYEEAVRLKKAKDARVGDARTAGKGINFGRKGMMSAKRFVDYCWNNYRLALTLEQAKEIIALHDRIVHEMRPYSRWAQSHERGRDTGIYDLIHPWSGRLRAGLGYSDVHNYPFQGLASDMAKLAMWLVMKACLGLSELGERDPLYGCRPVLFCHDSLTTEVPRSRAVAASLRQAELMTYASRIVMPDCPSKADATLANQLSKKNDAPLIVNGQLAVFDVWEQCALESRKLRNGTAERPPVPEPAERRRLLLKNQWPEYVVEDVMLSEAA